MTEARSPFLLLMHVRVALNREWQELNLRMIREGQPQEELDALRNEYNLLHAELNKKIEDHPRYKEINS